MRYLPFAERLNTSAEEHKFWVVFSVVNEADPYLEFYQKRQLTPTAPNSNGPVSKHPLKRCQHISPAIVVNDKCFNEFAITLDTHVIRLVADSQHSMQEWVECLKTKLRQLRILQPKDNLYTNGPQVSARQAWRPLPPIPVANSSNIAPVATTSTASEPRANSPTEIYEAIFDERTVPQRATSLEPLNSNVPIEEGPPPYEAISVNPPSPVSLRESQVLRLRKEIAHPSGVRLMVRKKDSHNSIALIDLCDGVWIAGWKQKEFPVLHNTFHIGDQLLSINGEPVSSAQTAHRLIKQNSLILEIIVKRVPNAKVFCIKRRTEGQDLGLVREGNTAEIKQVVPGGLADRAGLSNICSFANQQCNWCLTEVNNRALNLFFKSTEIHDRLNAVGKEISILVQPLDFIKKLKKQLKQIKNFKDYIVQ